MRHNQLLVGRNLLDSVLVAKEVVHEIRNKKKMCIIMKVGFEKTYDLIKLTFILYMLERLGLCKNWMSDLKIV